MTERSQEQQEQKRPRRSRGRRKGEGTVFERKGGTTRRTKPWVAEITLETGKQKTIGYFKTEAEAIAAKNKALRELEQGALVTGSRQTVENYLREWFETIQKQEVRQTTYLRQEPILYKVILPALGHIQLQKLTPQHIQKLYSDKLNEGWKPGSIRNIHKILHKALKNAARWKLVPQNVSDLVSLPRNIKHRAQTLTQEQTVKLLKIAQGHPLEPLVVLALATGMRHGEIAGLQWSDINFEEQTLEINRTISYVSGYGYVQGDPKTENSKRKIVLPKFVMRSLERYQDRQNALRARAGSQWQDLNLVFCNEATGYYRNPACTGQAFHRLLARAKLPQMRIHDLRHSAATLLILRMKMPVNLVQELLGHDDVETTLGMYTHVDPEMQRPMMDALDDLFGADF